MPANVIEIDVRVIPPRNRHSTIFDVFKKLAGGDSLLIVSDHDPRPLRYQLAVEQADRFVWTYEATGPELWRVRIDRR